jgi:uncharacterized protein YvpB
VFVDTALLSYWQETTQHAVVIVAIDEQYIYLYDPFFSSAPQTITHLEFELAWDEMDNTFACIAPSQ